MPERGRPVERKTQPGFDVDAYKRTPNVSAGWEHGLASIGIDPRAIPNSRILDVACGNAGDTLLEAPNIFGVDPNLGTYRFYGDGKDYGCIPVSVPERSVRAVAEELPFPDGAFQIVFSTKGVGWYPKQINTELALREMLRVAADPGGAVVFNVGQEMTRDVLDPILDKLNGDVCEIVHNDDDLVILGHPEYLTKLKKKGERAEESVGGEAYPRTVKEFSSIVERSVADTEIQYYDWDDGDPYYPMPDPTLDQKVRILGRLEKPRVKRLALSGTYVIPGDPVNRHPLDESGSLMRWVAGGGLKPAIENYSHLKRGDRVLTTVTPTDNGDRLMRVVSHLESAGPGTEPTGKAIIHIFSKEEANGVVALLHGKAVGMLDVFTPSRREIEEVIGLRSFTPDDSALAQPVAGRVIEAKVVRELNP